MTRQTSIDCYNQIKAEGLLSKMRLTVYEAILKNSPCTSGEAFASLKSHESTKIFQIRARCTELRDLGVIYEKGIRQCKITGRNVIEWDLTDRLPRKPIKQEKAVKYISIVEAEALLNKNKKHHYIIRRVGTDNQLNMNL